jgi:hypothetical protein
MQVRDASEIKGERKTYQDGRDKDHCPVLIDYTLGVNVVAR